MYLAALKAATEMARAVEEPDFAAQCEALAINGGAYVDRELFNGRYYAQKLKLDDRSALEPFDVGRNAGVLRDSFMQAYWSEEYGQIKYQIGGGCLADQILGQWHADLVGLGDLLSRENVDAALQSIYRENFRPSLIDHFNPCRVYAYENEAGLLVCSWPKGAEEPAVPGRVETGALVADGRRIIADTGRVERDSRRRHDHSRPPAIRGEAVRIGARPPSRQRGRADPVQGRTERCPRIRQQRRGAAPRRFSGPPRTARIRKRVRRRKALMNDLGPAMARGVGAPMCCLAVCA